MIATVHYHNTDTYQAVIRFEHDGVTYEDTFQLDMVIPGTMSIFEQYGLAFDLAAQLKVIERLKDRVKSMIESGGLKNPPEPVIPVGPEGVLDPMTPAEPEPDA